MSNPILLGAIGGIALAGVTLVVIRIASRIYWAIRITKLRNKLRRRTEKTTWKTLLLGSPPPEFLDLEEELTNGQKGEAAGAVQERRDPEV